MRTPTHAAALSVTVTTAAWKANVCRRSLAAATVLALMVASVSMAPVLPSRIPQAAAAHLAETRVFPATSALAASVSLRQARRHALQAVRTARMPMSVLLAAVSPSPTLSTVVLEAPLAVRTSNALVDSAHQQTRTRALSVPRRVLLVKSASRAYVPTSATRRLAALPASPALPVQSVSAAAFALVSEAQQLVANLVLSVRLAPSVSAVLASRQHHQPAAAARVQTVLQTSAASPVNAWPSKMLRAAVLASLAGPESSASKELAPD